MMNVNVLSRDGAPKPAVYVEPGTDPGSGRVRIVFAFRDDLRSEVREFETLSAALAYAQSLLGDDA